MIKQLVMGVCSSAVVAGVAACAAPDQASLASPSGSTLQMAAPPPAPAIQPPPAPRDVKRSDGYHPLDTRSYLHSHTPQWVWRHSAQQWKYLSTPDEWYTWVQGGNYIYAMWGQSQYAWWWIPTGFSGYVYRWNGSKWDMYRVGYTGIPPYIVLQ
jgi:hypothetical protein